MLSITGLIGGGLAGAGQAGGQVAQAAIDQANRLDYAQQMQEWEAKKQMLIDQNRVGLENQQRTAMVARMTPVKEGLINTAIKNKYSESDAAVAAIDAGQTDAPLTAEQRGAINQSKQADRDALNSDIDTNLKAAAITGDLPLTAQASMSGRVLAAEARADASRYGSDNRLTGTLAKVAGDEANTKTRTDSAEKIADKKVKAAQDLAKQKISALNPIDRATLSQANDLTKSAVDDRVIWAKLSDQMLVTPPKDKPALQAQIDAVRSSMEDKHARAQALLAKSAAAGEAFRASQAANQAAAPGALSQTPAGRSSTGGARTDVQSALDAWNGQQ